MAYFDAILSPIRPKHTFIDRSVPGSDDFLRLLFHVLRYFMEDLTQSCWIDHVPGSGEIGLDFLKFLCHFTLTKATILILTRAPVCFCAILFTSFLFCGIFTILLNYMSDFDAILFAVTITLPRVSCNFLKFLCHFTLTKPNFDAILLYLVDFPPYFWPIWRILTQSCRICLTFHHSFELFGGF